MAVPEPQRCTAHNKAGANCGQWAVAGFDKCRFHLGRRVEDAKIIQQAKANMVTYGSPREIGEHEALREEVWRTAGHVAWLEDQINTLDPNALIWGVSSEVVKDGTSDQGQAVGYTQVTKTAEITALLKLYHVERKHYVEVCATAIRCGIAEREVKLAEQQGELIAQVIRSLIVDPELGLNVEQQGVARRVASRHLRALPAA